MKSETMERQMTKATTSRSADEQAVLLGDEAVALGATHGGVSAAYAYPGTPSTEILSYMIDRHSRGEGPLATWTTNEKTSLEAGLGVSFVGKRSLVCMKHVGLNVAADPFMSASIVSINGGLVLAVADDPGMHSSQNEQDTRYFADFAHAICLEPADPQEAYDMTREGFEISERFHLPVLVRLVTRVAHNRAVVATAPQADENKLNVLSDGAQTWTLIPSNARPQYKKVIDQVEEIDAWSVGSKYNPLTLNPESIKLGVITTGIARGYYNEAKVLLEEEPSHLHISAYPMPKESIRKLAAHVDRIVVIEEGAPYVERYLRGILDQPVEIGGKLTGEMPRVGELNTALVRKGLGIAPPPGRVFTDLDVPGRPPQLCAGCAHADIYAALNEAREIYEESVVTSDIGCYTLGALEPYNAIESAVCMGASVAMAKGAADAGVKRVVAVIGDGTFCHSGITPLLDVVADNSHMTLLIADNETTAMTGAQPTIIESEKIEALVLGTGIDPAHCITIEAHRRNHSKLVDLLRQEMEYEGPSVIIAVRPCVKYISSRK